MAGTIFDAIEQNDVTAVTAFLDADKKAANAKDARGRTPLHAAAALGHAAIVALLLDRKAKADTKDKDHRAAIHLAALAGHEDVARLLSSRGAAIDVKAPKDYSALHECLWIGNNPRGALLLDRGASVNARLPETAKDLAGRTPLGMARMFGHPFVERLLSERGATDPQDVPMAGPRHSEIHTAAWNGEADDVRAILDADASLVDAVAPMGLITGTPLNKAATAGRVEVVRLLLARGASVQNDRGDCYTPLRDAAVQGHAEIVRLLVAAGANPNHNPNGRAPLLEATTFAVVDVVRTLLELGADPNVTNDKDRTPLWLLRHENRLGKPADVAACVALIESAGGRE